MARPLTPMAEGLLPQAYAGPNTAPDHPPSGQPNQAALIQDSTRLVYRQTSASLLGHLIGFIVTTLVYREHVPPT